MSARRQTSVLALVFIVFAWLFASVCLAEEDSFRMPTYADGEPPPPRSRDEVAKLIAGAYKAAETKEAVTGPFRIVLVAGPKDHGKGEHDYPAWQRVWSRLLSEGANTKVDTAWEFPSAEQTAAADVLVFYQRGDWGKARADAIDPFLARGGGLVYIHWAIDGRAEKEEMARRTGLSALEGKIKFRHGELNIDFAPGHNHPIARNFKNIRWVDESYWDLTGSPADIKLIGTSAEEGKPQPQFWTVERGPGRIFVSIPGHYAWTFDDPAFRILLLRGIAWAGRRDVDRFNKLVTLGARVK